MEQSTPPGADYDGVVCFSCGDWWYHNRGHFDMQLMRRFSRRIPVLYVNAMGMRFPSVGEGSMFMKRVMRKLKSVRRGFVRYADNFSVVSPFSVPMYSRPPVRWANALLVWCQIRLAMYRAGIQHPLVWVVSPPAGDVVRRLRRAALVYQRTDDFREFSGVNREIIAAMDENLVRAADLVVHVNRQLHDDSRSQGARSMLTSHGVDYGVFAATADGCVEPADIAAIEHPRVGFFGGIDSHTFDPELLLSVAAAMPRMHFALVGACSIDASRLSALPNVHFLGQKPYEQIPAYGRAFDVAIMPWRKNKWIAACNPVKLKEYLALGKPVVSTPYPEGVPYADVVYFASDAPAFVTAIEQALRDDSPTRRLQRQERVRHQTWDALARCIEEEIHAVLTDGERAC